MRVERTYVTEPPDFRGFFLHRSALASHGNMWEWECPWCAYSLLFPSGDRSVAEETAHSHILSSHGVKLWSDVMGAIRTLRSSLSSGDGLRR